MMHFEVRVAQKSVDEMKMAGDLLSSWIRLKYATASLKSSGIMPLSGPMLFRFGLSILYLFQIGKPTIEIRFLKIPEV
jgi:hypothetical protein